MVMILIICDFSYEILYESSIHLFFKSKENMRGLRDAAFASCWESAAMETKQIWTWVCSCSIIYCVDCFIFKSGWGQGISIFFSNSLNFWVFVYCSFQCLFLSFQYSHMSLAVLVLEMFLDVLYFHSCGIVGIMMVMIKLAHLCCLWIVCWMWALGFIWHSEEKTQYMNSRWGLYNMWECCGLSSLNTLNALCNKKQKTKKKKPI